MEDGQPSTIKTPECAFYTKPASTTPYDWEQLFHGTPAGLTTTEPPGLISIKVLIHIRILNLNVFPTF